MSVYSKSLEEYVETPCPLCESMINGMKRLRIHLGRHLEELARFALPNVNTDASDPDSHENSSQSSLPEEMLGGKSGRMTRSHVSDGHSSGSGSLEASKGTHGETLKRLERWAEEEAESREPLEHNKQGPVGDYDAASSVLPSPSQ